MNKKSWRNCARWTAIAAVGAATLAGCASTDESSLGGSSAGGGDFAVGFIGEQTSGTPADGGVVSFGSFGFPAVLDPAQSTMSGSTGGSELTAIYDTLVRFDPEQHEFVPQLAEGVESSEGGQVWTVTLREGTTFSDGTVLDSAAVTWSFDRFVAAGRSEAQTWSNIVDRVETPDPRTVVIHLARPWNDFPSLLSSVAGAIVAPSSAANGGFTPTGAGPFTVTRFAPNEVLELAPRADYVGGKPHLDGLRFVPSPDPTALVESVQSGQLNAGYLYNSAEAMDTAIDAGMEGYRDVQGTGVIGIINAQEGTPGSDVRVRRAIALAIDPEALNQRVSQGKNPVSTALFPEGSKWHNPDVPGIAYDPDEARSLLDEAKADGYDGKLNYVSVNLEATQNIALGVQAMLNAVGFDVAISKEPTPTAFTTKIYVDKDFDMARSGAPLYDAAPYVRLYSALGSDSKLNASGYADEKMDELLVQLQSAPDEAAEQAAIDAIQQRANETAPFSIWGPTLVFAAWQPDVHGVKVSTDNVMLFDDAWISK
ncbi:ABC transporter substrate-binding protein [Rhodococcus sp. NPDC003322]